MQPCAIGIVKDPKQQNHVLWVKRRDLKIWVLPGGGIDQNETPEQAVIREVKEESGLNEVSILRKTAVYHPVNEWTGQVHLFLCQAKDNEIKNTDESVDGGFFPVDQLPHPHFPLHAGWLKETWNNENMVERPLLEFSWKRVFLFLLFHPVIMIKYFIHRLSINAETR